METKTVGNILGTSWTALALDKDPSHTGKEVFLLWKQYLSRDNPTDGTRRDQGEQ